MIRTAPSQPTMAGEGLRAALVTPLTGPLARYGRAGATALELWAGRAGVELQIANAQPSVAAAVAAVTSWRPIHVLFGPYGASPAVAAAQAAPSVLWNHGGATDRLARSASPNVVNVPAPACTYLAAVIDALGADMLADSHAMLLHSTTGFGREVADGAHRAADRVGMPITSVAFRPGGGEEAARRSRRLTLTFSSSPAGSTTRSPSRPDFWLPTGESPHSWLLGSMRSSNHWASGLPACTAHASGCLNRQASRTRGLMPAGSPPRTAASLARPRRIRRRRRSPPACSGSAASATQGAWTPRPR